MIEIIEKYCYIYLKQKYLLSLRLFGCYYENMCSVKGATQNRFDPDSSEDGGKSSRPVFQVLRGVQLMMTQPSENNTKIVLNQGRNDFEWHLSLSTYFHNNTESLHITLHGT